MPGVHRNGDTRKCGGTTQVSGQSNVYVNGELWAVEGDVCTHGSGDLVANYGSQNVYINGKLVICAVGDQATDDNLGHVGPGQTDPLGHSYDVIVYAGRAGGGT